MFLLLFLSHKFVHVRLWSCYFWEAMSRVLLFSVVKYCLENMMIACKQALHLGGRGEAGKKSCYSMVLAAMFPGGLT